MTAMGVNNPEHVSRGTVRLLREAGHDTAPLNCGTDASDKGT
jgi:hypothetical protein